MTRRVLLTGAGGFLGAHALRVMLDRTDWQFVCPVSFRHKGIPERLTWAVGPIGDDRWQRVEASLHDLAAPVLPQTAATWGEIDTILNFAADTHPPRSVRQPVEFIHNNVDIALYLLEYARTLKSLDVFVQISTDSVYGPAPEGAHDEWDPIVPNNPYSASKAMQEAPGIAYWRCYDIPYVIAATMNPMGITQDREKFLPMTVRSVLYGETVTIHTDKDTRPGARTYIHAPDMVAGLLHVLALGPPSRFGTSAFGRPDRWNIAGVTEVDNLTAAKTIAAALGRPLRYALSTVDRPEHGHRYAMSAAKLAEAGWQADPDIEGAITRMAQWTAAYRHWIT